MRILICDKCREEIPTTKKRHPITGKITEYYRMGELISPLGGTMNLGVDLCERCAGQINIEMLNIIIAFKDAALKGAER